MVRRNLLVELVKALDFKLYFLLQGITAVFREMQQNTS
jgi:hypothetical protein